MLHPTSLVDATVCNVADCGTPPTGYVLSTSPVVGWHAAKAYCEERGMRLATIRTEAENTAAVAAITAGGHNGAAWFALNDLAEDGVYEFDVGAAGAAPQNPNTPTPSSESLPLSSFSAFGAANQEAQTWLDCGDVSNNPAGVWRMRSCNQEKPALCEVLQTMQFRAGKPGAEASNMCRGTGPEEMTTAQMRRSVLLTYREKSCFTVGLRATCGEYGTSRAAARRRRRRGRRRRPRRRPRSTA